MKNQYMITDGKTIIEGSLEAITHTWNLIRGFSIPCNNEEQKISELTGYDLVPIEF